MPSLVQTLELGTASGFYNPSGSGTLSFPVWNIPTGQGVASNLLDLGPQRSRRYRWRSLYSVPSGSLPSTPSGIDVYLGTLDLGDLFSPDSTSGVYPVATAPTTYSQLDNLHHVAHCPTTGQWNCQSGTLDVDARYVYIVWVNLSSYTVGVNQLDNLFQLAPIPEVIGYGGSSVPGSNQSPRLNFSRSVNSQYLPLVK